jgi:hypothetical protein
MLIVSSAKQWIATCSRSLPVFVDRPRFFGLYQNLFSALVRSLAHRLEAFFGLVCLGKEAFSQLMIIKSRYRSRLTDEHSLVPKYL